VTDLLPSLGAARQAKAGAGDEARTRDVHLGKVVLYQLSYTRVLRANNNVQPPAPRNLLIAPAGVKLLNPNWAVSASYDQSINMKKLILLCICSIALAAGLFAQAPTASPIASPPAPTVTPTTTASVSPSDLADRIHQKLEKKL